MSHESTLHSLTEKATESYGGHLTKLKFAKFEFLWKVLKFPILLPPASALAMYMCGSV